MSRYPYIDRTSCIVAAGKPIGNPCENVKDLLREVKLEDKVEAIRKQFGFIEAKDYGSEWFKPPDSDTSGAFTEIKHCLRPPVPSRFHTLNDELKSTIYDSYWNKSLGKSRDPTPGLPACMIPSEVTMGKPNEKVAGGEVINPPKKFEEIEAEERLYHDLYAFSHQNHYPGQQIKIGGKERQRGPKKLRDDESQDLMDENPVQALKELSDSYKAPFNENNIFGKPSNKDGSGERTKRSLTWFNNDPLSNVSRRQANVRSRTLPQLGKGIDRTGVSDLFPADHTFGKPSSRDFYGVEDLLNECTPSLVRRDMLTFLSYANSLRQSVYKKINMGDLALEELYEEMMNLNKNEEVTDCALNFDCIDKVMKKHRIYLDLSKLQPLLLTLGLLSQDGKIKISDFIKFIDKNARFPELKQQHYILPPEFQSCNQKCHSDDSEDKYSIQSMPPAGKPTVRLDKRCPVYQDSIIYMDELAEETTARTLISPSIYTQYGLSHRDFFQPRSKEYLGNLFKKIGVTLPDEELDEIYKEGLETDKTGGVSIETFRNFLDERAYKAYNKLQ